MKVIRGGPDPNAWKYELDCMRCTSRLEIELSDIKLVGSYGDMRESSGGTYVVQCEVCQAQCHLDRSSVPRHFRHLVKVSKA